MGIQVDVSTLPYPTYLSIYLLLYKVVMMGTLRTTYEMGFDDWRELKSVSCMEARYLCQCVCVWYADLHIVWPAAKKENLTVLAPL